MPEQFDDYRRPEELLPGSDRPRRLSPALRTRLERSLIGLAGDTGPAAAAPAPHLAPVPAPVPAVAAAASVPAPAAKALSPEVRDRLENSLRPSRNRAARNWRVVVAGAGVAAAIAVLAAILVPQLVNSPSRPGGTVAAKAVVPSVARFGLGVAPSSRAPSARPPGGKSQGGPGGGPGRPPRARSGPARFAPSRSGAVPLVPGPVVPSSALPSSVVPSPAVPSPAEPSSGAAGPAVTGRPATAPGPMAAVVEAPTVSGVSPHHGPVGGGNWVVVTGLGFVGVSAVDFGAVSTVTFTVASPVRLKVRAPLHAAGTVDIVVAAEARRSNISALDRYTFGP
ncbi:MAG: IPT/TIG domain-containing protein [Acidimicrobiales bacterium]